nr:DUF3443 family protein [Paraburkholderia kirstenboschensis]
MKRADVTIGGKLAGNLPVQVIGDGANATPPDCASRGVSDIGSVAQLGANGVVGIGSAVRDFPLAAQYVLPATYYYCPSTGSCTSTRVPLDTQIMNPVADFTTDNNGTIIRLPALQPGGQASAAGELVFGIGTQQNNGLPTSANIIPLDSNGFSRPRIRAARSATALSTAARTRPSSAIRPFRSTRGVATRLPPR